jgi:hypothetical protein
LCPFGQCFLAISIFGFFRTLSGAPEFDRIEAIGSTAARAPIRAGRALRIRGPLIGRHARAPLEIERRDCYVIADRRRAVNRFV